MELTGIVPVWVIYKRYGKFLIKPNFCGEKLKIFCLAVLGMSVV